MTSDAANPNESELLGNLTWARELAVQLVGEAYADDVLQETRLAALKSRSESAGRVLSRSWFRVVLRRFALQRLRSESARKIREESAAKKEALPSPADLAARLEQQQLISRLISALAEPYRSTLLLRYSEGLEPKQIAQRLGIPSGTVRWRLNQAIDSLRAKLDREHDGDRDAWANALFPLLLAPAASHLETIAGAGIIKVSLVMKKLCTAAALIVLASLTAWQLGVLSSPEQAATDELATIPELPESSPIEAMTSPMRAERAADFVDAVEPNAPVQKLISGWWLVGRVDGIPTDDSERAELLIVGKSFAASHTIRSHAEPDGSVRIDLAEIFEADDLLPSELRVTASHAGLRPAEQRWSVNREQRQAGFRGGELALFEFQLELRPPLGNVCGEVRVPEGFESSEIHVALIHATDGAPNGCAVDQSTCNSNGQFRLNYSDPGSYHVLVSHEKQELLPGFAQVNVDGGETVLESAISLSKGTVLTGVITWNGARTSFEAECELATRSNQATRFCTTLEGHCVVR